MQIFSHYRRVLLLLLLFGALLVPSYAQAHGGADQTFVRGLGPYQLTLTIHAAQQLPGPLRIELLIDGGTPDGLLLLHATPAGGPAGAGSQARLHAVAAHRGPYYTQLMVDHAGRWNLELRTDGSAGVMLPFVVAAPGPSTSELALSAALAALATGIVLAGLLGLLSQRSVNT